MANIVNSGAQSQTNPMVEREDSGVKMCADPWGGEKPAASAPQLPQGDISLVVLPLPYTGTELSEQLFSNFNEYTNH